jgi:hypothetical protein
MTTGRINQVTIVHRSAEAQRPNPRRGGLYQEGDRRSNPNRLPRKRAGRNRSRRPIHLPPLSSPRRGPPRSPTGVAANNKPAACTPQEEKAHAASHTRSADRQQDGPQRAGEIVGRAINPQTPKLVPAHGSEQDFRRQAQVRVQCRSAASSYRP